MSPAVFKGGALATIVFCLFAAAGLATAGESAGAAVLDHFSAEEAASFSKQIEHTLAERGARVALVFRSGRTRDRLPDGVRFTHGAFWVYQPIARADGSDMRGYVTYNLFHGDGNSLPRERSYLSTEFPFAFVAGSAVDDVAIIVPTPAMQKRLYRTIASETYGALHQPAYSLISNPGDPRFQNCTEFLLDVIAAAAWQTSDRAQLKANLEAHFVPSRIETDPFARLFGPMADSRLVLRDHEGGPIETATFSSLSHFMMEHSLADEAFTLAITR